MALSGGYGWPRSPPLAPDTSSPIYPERPIRPLPKRRIRDRLSSECAEQFSSPPQPPSSQLFNFPYVADRGQEARFQDYGGDDYSCKRCVDQNESEVDSDDEAVHGSYRSFNGQHAGDREGTPSQQQRNPPAPDSTASSGDGYESFENTNNKKKRKIPQSNGLLGSGHDTVVTPSSGNPRPDGREDPALSLSDVIRGVGSYYGSGTAAMSSVAVGNGLAGAGRGRYGKNRSPIDRRPLTNVTNNASMASPSTGRVRASTVSGTKGSPAPPQGIISAAIANAAQHSPNSTNQGNENISLLQQQTNRTPPPKTEFTFQSDASKGLSWPGAHHTDIPSFAPAQPRYTNSALPARAMHHATGGAAQYPSASQPQQATAAPPPEPPRRKARRPGKIYELAARQRRVQQEYQNYTNPPRREEIWVCEFCEYEDIFGTPPLALIREYERKDRIERKRIAEKRRLLEKAKAKGRRGRKGTKNSKNQAATAPAVHANDPHGLSSNDPRYDPPADLDYGDEEEEYYEDDYIDDEDLPPGVEGEEEDDEDELYEDSLDGDDETRHRSMPGSFHGAGGGGGGGGGGRAGGRLERGSHRRDPVPDPRAGARFEDEVAAGRNRGLPASV